MQEAILKIDNEVAQHQGDSMIFTTGEILKQLCQNPSIATAIIATDKKIADCQKAIDAAAEKKRQGNRSCIGMKEAEGIIKAFYGITEDAPKSEKVVSLLDML